MTVEQPTEDTPLSDDKPSGELIISIKWIQEARSHDRCYADNGSHGSPNINDNVIFSASLNSPSAISVNLRAITSLLAPVDWHDFLRDKWSQAFMIIKGEKNKFDELFTWDDLNTALEQHRLAGSRLRIEKNGRHLGEAAYTLDRPTLEGESVKRLDVRRIYDELRHGATLVLNTVDEISANVSSLCESLTRTFLSHCQVNAYATLGETPGFGLHWDDHDVFVLQVAGQKYWKIYPMTCRAPFRRDAVLNEERPSAVEWEGIIEQGDLIYIPRGQWHEATGVSVPTLHLTFGVKNPTGIALLSWLLDELQSEEIWRQDIPIFADADLQDAHAALLRGSIDRAINKGICARYSDAIAGAMYARPHFSLPEGISDCLDPDVVPKIRFSGMTFSNLRIGEVNFSFNAIGRSWMLHNSLLPIIKPLLDGNAINVASLSVLARNVSPKRLNEAMARLVREGLVSAYRAI